MIQGGYIKLFRALKDKPIWKQSTPEQKVILITVLLMANFEPKQWEWSGEIITIQPGQFISSVQHIADECGKKVSVQNVKTALKRFQKFQFLTDKSTNHGRLITIINWGSYQADSKNLTNELNGDQPTTNQRLTTTKEGKKEKNINIESVNTLSSPSQGLDDANENNPPADICPHQKIIDLYHEILPELPHVRVWSESSKKNLRARWREDTERQSLDFWRQFFEYVRQSRFLMGNKNDFSASLSWLAKPTNFEKTMNGNYHNHNPLRLIVSDRHRENKEAQEEALRAMGES